MKTVRLYWDDDHRVEAEAVVVAVAGREVVLDQTCFYPGGGGQPCDLGFLDGRAVTAVRADEEGAILHTVDFRIPDGPEQGVYVVPVPGVLTRFEIGRVGSGIGVYVK